MGNYKISLNQLAEFYNATDAGKEKIVNQQMKPNPFLIPWYQLPKARLKKSLGDNGNLDPVIDALGILKSRVPKNRRQEIDRQVSIEALERFVEMQLPSIFKETEYEVIKPKRKSTIIGGVDVLVAPDLVIKSQIDGDVFYGGVKIHISKGKPFSIQQGKIVSDTILTYLTAEVIKPGEFVLPEACYCLDIFAGRIVPAKAEDHITSSEVRNICKKVKQVWDSIND
ncbi:hypothetical protein [Reichenbachiella sp.]|uniref:hypothetical protein n=1 Tax=Reichenbachiella sp. TaxID=2184521 RepID=UPI003BB10059